MTGRSLCSSYQLPRRLNQLPESGVALQVSPPPVIGPLLRLSRVLKRVQGQELPQEPDGLVMIAKNGADPRLQEVEIEVGIHIGAGPCLEQDAPGSRYNRF